MLFLEEHRELPLQPGMILYYAKLGLSVSYRNRALHWNRGLERPDNKLWCPHIFDAVVFEQIAVFLSELTGLPHRPRKDMPNPLACEFLEPGAEPVEVSTVKIAFRPRRCELVCIDRTINAQPFLGDIVTLLHCISNSLCVNLGVQPEAEGLYQLQAH